MKTLIIASVFAFFTTTAFAQGPPKFFQDTYPEHALKSALEARGVLEGEGAQLDAKTRELIALAVAAQIPCAYCVYGHTKNAQAKGATEAEIRKPLRLLRPRDSGAPFSMAWDMTLTLSRQNWTKGVPRIDTTERGA